MEDKGTGEISQSLDDRLARLFQNPELINIITSFVANGGTLITLCETWDVPFGRIASWLHADKAREKLYIAALNDRGEWGVESVLKELRALAHSDIRAIFNECGGLKPVHEWPAVTASAIASFDVVEIWGMEGEGKNKERVQIGELKKIKFWDKGRALELLGKNLKLFVDKLELSGKVTLADLLMGKGEETKS